jgi:hypothetical protein
LRELDATALIVVEILSLNSFLLLRRTLQEYFSRVALRVVVALFWSRNWATMEIFSEDSKCSQRKVQEELNKKKR